MRRRRQGWLVALRWAVLGSSGRGAEGAAAAPAPAHGAGLGTRDAPLPRARPRGAAPRAPRARARRPRRPCRSESTQDPLGQTRTRISCAKISRSADLPPVHSASPLQSGMSLISAHIGGSWSNQLATFTGMLGVSGMASLYDWTPDQDFPLGIASEWSAFGRASQTPLLPDSENGGSLAVPAGFSWAEKNGTPCYPCWPNVPQTFEKSQTTHLTSSSCVLGKSTHAWCVERGAC